MRQGMVRASGVLMFMLLATGLLCAGGVSAQEADNNRSSYMPVDIKEDFATTMARMKKDKPAVMKRQMDLLAERYDLSNRPAKRAALRQGETAQAKALLNVVEAGGAVRPA